MISAFQVTPESAWAAVRSSHCRSVSLFLTIHRRPVVLPSGEMADVLEPPLQWCLPNSGTRERFNAHAPLPAVANPGLSLTFITGPGLKRGLERSGDHVPQRQGTNLQPDWGK